MTERSLPRRLAPHLGALLTAAGASVLMTWPLARGMGDHILKAIYWWDAFTNTMVMGARVDAATGRAALSLYDSYYFAPISDTITFNENHFGLSLIFAPFYLATGNPLWAYNLTLLVSLALSVYFTFLLVRQLGGSGLAGIVAGVAFAFSPYVTFEWGRIQLVATQWIPLCFLLLHRAVEGQRLRDIVGLGLCYLLQIGTCLYYAMFLIPLLTLGMLMLVERHRPPRAFFMKLGGVAAAAGAIALLMVYPYFTSRKAFSLERTEAFASTFDGKLSFFANVHDTNRTLTSMHHRSWEEGAHEEIAFPGFVVLAMLAIALLWPIGRALRAEGVGHVARSLGWLLATVAAGYLAFFLTHSMLGTVAVCAASAWYGVRRGRPVIFEGGQRFHMWLALLAVGMYLGLAPLDEDPSYRGLYYYFHSYVPGFNGIRKVSRQAVMTTFALAVLSSYGTTVLLRALRLPWLQALVTGVLLAAMCYEFRTFPNDLQSVAAGKGVPPAYRWLSERRGPEPIAVAPPDNGKKLYRGARGRALHNYMALYHGRRTLNGKSTWVPPVTELVHRSLRNLPHPSATRILQSLGTKYLLVHNAELTGYRRSKIGRLKRDRRNYRHVFSGRGDDVYEILQPDDPSLGLVAVPPVPPGATVVPTAAMLEPAVSRAPDDAMSAIDGDPSTRWKTRGGQRHGDYFELRLEEPRHIVGIEFKDYQQPADAPLSFKVQAWQPDGTGVTLMDRRKVRLFSDMVYRPKEFSFRVTWPQPVLTERVRVTVQQPVMGRWFAVNEAVLYEAAAP